MNSRVSNTFWELYERLPSEIQERADRAYSLWQENPFHPSLHFKALTKGDPSFWSARVGLQYRVLGRRREIEGQDTIIWYWIGPHAEYDRMLPRLPR